MKRTLGILVLLTALAMSASAISLTNPGFETGDFTGWLTFGGDWRVGVGADANSGTYGVVNDVLSSGGDTFRGVYQNLPAVAGNLYSGSVYIRSVSVDSSESYFEMQFLNAAGSVIAEYQSTHVTGNQGFTQVGLNYVVAPVGTVTVSVRGVTFMVSTPGDTDFHIFDDFTVDEVVPPPPLLDNAGFETGDFTSWSTFGSGWRASGGDAFSGSYGIVNDVLTTDGDAFRGVFQNVEVTAGSTYSVGVQIKAVNVESSQSWLELQWLNAAGGVISQLQGSYVTSDQAFTLSALNELVAPAGAVTASVRGIVQMLSAPATDTDFHAFDDFFLLEPADLEVSIAATTNYLQTGTEVTYSITIRNGSIAGSGLYHVTNDLSPNLVYLSSSDGGVNNGQYVSWTLNDLSGGASTTITVTANQPVFNGSTQETVNAVSVSVNSTVGDPDTSNNTASTSATTVGVPMLTTLAFILLGAVIVYAFIRQQRHAAGTRA